MILLLDLVHGMYIFIYSSIKLLCNQEAATSLICQTDSIRKEDMDYF